MGSGRVMGFLDDDFFRPWYEKVIKRKRPDYEPGAGDGQTQAQDLGGEEGLLEEDDADDRDEHDHQAQHESAVHESVHRNPPCRHEAHQPITLNRELEENSRNSVDCQSKRPRFGEIQRSSRETIMSDRT